MWGTKGRCGREGEVGSRRRRIRADLGCFDAPTRFRGVRDYGLEFGSLGVWGLGVWGFGGLGVWGFGSLGVWGVWGFGGLGVWGFGGLGVWGFGGLGVWGSLNSEPHRVSGACHVQAAASSAETSESESS